MKTLLLFIDSYESNWKFVKNEIPYLTPLFKQVVLVPRQVGSVQEFPKVNDITTDNSFAVALLRNKNALLKLIPAFTAQPVANELCIIAKKRKLTDNVIKTVKVYANAMFVQNWLEGYCFQNGIDANNLMVYTFWYDYITLGAGWCKSKYPGLRVISRAHDYDLYEERQSGQFFPFREQSLQTLDRLFLISDHGKEYLARKYPWAENKFSVSKMGVRDPGFLNAGSSDKTLRAVSCSDLVALKRVDLILDGLRYLAERNPSLKIHWRHIGDGPLRTRMQKSIARVPPNLQIQFTGRLDNEEVLRYYQEHAVDVFINASQYEGLPVSIMEAQSCGIPAVAPSIGGIPEMVTNENGVLMNANPSPEEIAGSIWEVYRDRLSGGRKRHLSRLTWQNHFDAEKNHKNYAMMFSSLYK